MSLGCAYEGEVPPSAEKPETALYASNVGIFLKGGDSNIEKKYVRTHTIIK